MLLAGAASVGFALTTGYGTAAAEPSASDSSDSSGASASSSSDGPSSSSPSGGSPHTGATGDGNQPTTTVGGGGHSAAGGTGATSTNTADTSDATADDDPTESAGTVVRHRRTDATTTSPASAKVPRRADADELSAATKSTAPAAHDEKPARADAVSSTEDAAVDDRASSVAVAQPVRAASATPSADFSPAQQAATPPTSVVTIPGAVDTPAVPVEPPSMWTVLAWVRRQLEVSIVAAAYSPRAVVSSSTSASSATSASTVPTVDVKDYGAIGDGVTDDSTAIKAAVAALTSGGRLYIPLGDYRFAQQHPAGDAAIYLNGLSDVTVEFAPGARLLMDNLDANGLGTSHGIRVEGTASHVAILNPTIEWVVRPSARSFGDGISVLGYPSDSPPPSGWTGSTGKVEFVSIVNGRTVNAPQAGAVIMGASDVTVTNFTAIGTLADGLHFNSNRRVTVDGLVAQNTGDDGLAFVTYYDPTQPWTYGPTDGPFNQPGLGEWNNGGSVASHISVTGGRASGVRVQGGYDITISDVTVSGKEFGVQINSAKATGPGDWTSLASRNIHISGVTVDGAQTGIVLGTNNIDGTEDSKWWDFAGSSISDVTIRGSKNWSIAVETPATTTSKFAGITLQNIHAESMAADGPFGGGNGGILLASLRDSVIDDVRLVSDHASDVNLLGAGQLRSGISAEDLPSSNLQVNDLVLQGPGRILIQDIAGVDFGNVASYGADASAVMLYRVSDSTFDHIGAYLPGRGSGAGYGVRLLQVFDVDVEEIEVITDAHVGSTWWAVEFGGGNPTEGVAGRGVRVEDVTYVSDRDATASDIAWQGGPYGPVDWYISATWRHDGETSPQWRSALYGDTSPV
ncbi:hypothetical protein H7K45_13770 [Mycobacterium yunnanensis]|uniref:Rhamnogalacturonase A/B/Epimerase-like pectate lyase domain-containing protein n=2 Tax=Mycobacterium yunnanensis TaxID=368477 RepID=A0A9X3BTX5_9MYCO|nr:hypothetical protein [Mycobacterium yunnanensis]